MVNHLADYLKLPTRKPAQPVSVPPAVPIPGGLQTAPVAVPAKPAGKFALGEQSRARLKGVHPDLVKVVERAIAITDVDFIVLEGLRDIETQRGHVKSGASKTMNSRHLTGHAVDIAPYLDTDRDGDQEHSWHWPHYYPLAKVIKQAAKEVGVPIEWGGDWKFKDGPHWQLPWASYPK
jgi:peptidoglycan L-alanyl-D-glutamate endopeptidase CwlK